MTKTEQAAYERIVEALKKNHCITDCRFEDRIAIPEWLPGGCDLVIAELIRSKSPFGLRNRDRGYLVLMLPVDMRHKLDSAIGL
jgi:hypothetical protein